MSSIYKPYTVGGIQLRTREEILQEAVDEVTPDNPNGVGPWQLPKNHRFMRNDEKIAIREVYENFPKIKSIRGIFMNIPYCWQTGLGHSWWKATVSGASEDITYAVPLDFDVERILKIARQFKHY